MSTVTTPLTAAVDDWPDPLLNVVLRYHPDYDPYAVALIFPGTAWFLGRDLLIAGTQSSDGVGDGDVHIGRDANAVVICLSSADGHLTVRLQLLDVQRFLADTLAAVPLGAERVDVDEWLTHLLEEAP